VLLKTRQELGEVLEQAADELDRILQERGYNARVTGGEFRQSADSFVVTFVVRAKGDGRETGPVYLQDGGPIVPLAEPMSCGVGNDPCGNPASVGVVLRWSGCGLLLPVCKDCATELAKVYTGDQAGADVLPVLIRGDWLPVLVEPAARRGR
jgi:hypothetical protein